MRLLWLAVLSCTAIAAGPAANAACPPKNGYVLTAGDRHVLLACDGKPSAHPQAKQACAETAAAGGDPARLSTAQSTGAVFAF